MMTFVLGNLCATGAGIHPALGPLTDEPPVKPPAAEGKAFSANGFHRYDPLPLPNNAMSYYPNDGDTNVSTITTLSWDYSGPPILGYKVYLGTDYPPANIVCGYETTCQQFCLLNLVAPDTKYYWKIVPFNDSGNATGCPVLNFRTSVNLSGLMIPYYEPVDFCCVFDLPLGWLAFDYDANCNTWLMVNEPGYTGDHSLQFSACPGSFADDWLISPPLRLDAGVNYLFQAMCKTHDAKEFGKLELYFGTAADPAILDQSPVSTNWILSGPGYQPYTFAVVPDTDGIYYFGIHISQLNQSAAINLDDIQVIAGNSSAVQEVEQVTAVPCLKAIYPNPCGSRVTIEYELPKSAAISLELYNLRGQRVCTLENANKAAGTHQLNLNLREKLAGLPAGVYLCRLISPGFSQTQRLLYQGTGN